MKKKRGRPVKKHEPVKASFNEVLSAISKSEYNSEEKLKDKKK